MDISINIPNLVAGVIFGFIPTFSIMYFKLKSSIGDNEKNITIQQKDIESIGAINKQIESNYQEKIESLEKELAKQSSQHSEEVESLKGQISSLKEEHKTEIKLAKEELSILTYPYEEQRGENGLISDDRSAEIGYKFQLFIRGIPCFEAHQVPIQKLYKKEVSLEKIKSVTTEVVNLLETLSKNHPAISVADKFAKLAK